MINVPQSTGFLVWPSLKVFYNESVPYSVTLFKDVVPLEVKTVKSACRKRRVAPLWFLVCKTQTLTQTSFMPYHPFYYRRGRNLDRNGCGATGRFRPYCDSPTATSQEFTLRLFHLQRGYMPQGWVNPDSELVHSMLSFDHSLRLTCYLPCSWHGSPTCCNCCDIWLISSVCLIFQL